MKNCKSWIKEKLIDYDFSVKQVNKHYEEFIKETDSNSSYASFQQTVSRVKRNLLNDLKDDGSHQLVIDEANKVNSIKQKLQDKNNVVSKLNRETYRIFNCLEDLNTELINTIKNTEWNIPNAPKLPKKNLKNRKYAVITLSDIHAGCLVEKHLELNNEYNFEILANRLRYYIQRSIEECNAKEITDILVVGLGDFISSQRRLSEKTTSAASITRSIMLMSYILIQALHELRKNFETSVLMISGNESRIYETDNMSSSDWLVSENGDYAIFNIVRMIYEIHKTDITFIKTNFREVTYNFGGVDFLFLHGDTLKSKSNINKKIKDLVGDYMLNKKRNVDFIVFGHFHTSDISDYYCGVASLMGSDHYSNRDLRFTNRASQTILFIENKSVEGKRIDLQNIYYDYPGYDIKSELEYYNVKPISANTEVVIRNLV